MKKLVYVAGPFTTGGGTNVISNIRAATLVADHIANLGFGVFIPHLNFAWELAAPHEYEFWLDQDVQVLLRCDAVYRIQRASQGADIEEEVAKEHNIPIFYDYETLMAWKQLYETHNADGYPG